MYAIHGARYCALMAREGGLSPTMFLHSQGLFFTTSIYTYAFVSQGGPHFSRVAWAHGLSAGIGRVAAAVCLLEALKLGEVSVATAISQLSFVVSVILAALWMRERLTVRKIGGLLLALVTISVFSV